MDIVNEIIIDKDTSSTDVGRLQQIAEDVIRRCRARARARPRSPRASTRASASTCASAKSRRSSTRATAAFGVTVYFGKRKGSAQHRRPRPESIAQTIEQACAIARYTEEDPAHGPRRSRAAREGFSAISTCGIRGTSTPQEAIELGIEIEDAGRAFDPRITNSEGATVQAGASLSVYANSHGFVGTERGTRHSLSCALIAEDDAGMQRDYWYDDRARREAISRPPSRSAARPPSARSRDSTRASFDRASARCCSRRKSRAA